MTLYIYIKCNDPRCGTCEHLIEGSTFKINSKEFTVKSNMTCSSTNIIYVLKCTNCEDFYIGQSINLRKRVTVHRQQIVHAEHRHLHVSKHIHSCAADDFKIFPIYKVFANQEQNVNLLLDSKEMHFIKLFNPPLNHELA